MTIEFPKEGISRWSEAVVVVTGIMCQQGTRQSLSNNDGSHPGVITGLCCSRISPQSQVCFESVGRHPFIAVQFTGVQLLLGECRIRPIKCTD